MPVLLLSLGGTGILACHALEERTLFVQTPKRQSGPPTLTRFLSVPHMLQPQGEKRPHMLVID
jgi:hypothetical protein